MTDFLKCPDCARIVKVVREGRGDLVCCGKPMRALANFESVDALLDFAIEKETEARDFYLEWAGKLEAAHLAEMFRGFAGEELKHRERLERVKAGSSFKAPAAKVTDLKIVDYLVDVMPAPDMDYQEALIVAMHREKVSYKLYNDLAAICEGADVKAMFLALAQEEAKHKLRMEAEYEKDIISDN